MRGKSDPCFEKCYSVPCVVGQWCRSHALRACSLWLPRQERSLECALTSWSHQDEGPRLVVVFVLEAQGHTPLLIVYVDPFCTRWRWKRFLCLLLMRNCISCWLQTSLLAIPHPKFAIRLVGTLLLCDHLACMCKRRTERDRYVMSAPMRPHLAGIHVLTPLPPSKQQRNAYRVKGVNGFDQYFFACAGEA